MSSLPSWRWGPSSPQSRWDWGSCSAPPGGPAAHSAGRRSDTSSEMSAQGWDLERKNVGVLNWNCLHDPSHRINGVLGG